VHVQVRDRLRDHVVHRHEAAGLAHRARHRGAQPLNARKQRLDLLRRQVGERPHVAARHHQHVPVEQRPAVEERHRVPVVEDLRRGQLAGDDRAEDAAHRRPPKPSPRRGITDFAHGEAIDPSTSRACGGQLGRGHGGAFGRNALGSRYG
jgi:hypothetical protein